MSDRPILFSTTMVQAILDGRKTQTRRVIKPQPVRDARDVIQVAPLLWHIGRWLREGITNPAGWAEPRKCPYGDPGDLLWVRETWAYCKKCGDYQPENPKGVVYRADGDGFSSCHICHPKTLKPDYRWRPSIHMPRWASRIILEVVNVRVERVLDITPDDAKAEGIQVIRDAYKGAPEEFVQEIYVRHFANLWNSINASRGYSWESNPWVWAVDFKVIMP